MLTAGPRPCSRTSLTRCVPRLAVPYCAVPQDATFHQCVNLGAYETQKTVTFVPPDGEFELMRYRCSEGIALPFKVGTRMST